MDDKVKKDNLTDLASSLASQNDNSQPQQADNSQSPNSQPSQQDQQPAQNLADNQVVGSNGEVIDLGRTSEGSNNK